MTINTQKQVVILAGPTGPTGTMKGVNILGSFTGPTGTFAQWSQYTGPTGASMAKGVFESVYNIGPTGIKGEHKTVIVPGYSTFGLPGASIDMSFITGQYLGVSPSGLTVANASGGTDLLPTSASGAAYNTFAANTLRLTPGVGVLVEESRVQQLLNSTAPVTQTTGSLAIGTYTLWVNGAGSATVSAGSATITGAGTATNGTPVTFAVTVAGTVTVTVSGSLNAFQLELGTWGTSLIVSAGAIKTRNADVISITSPPSFGSAYSLYGQGTPHAPVAYTSDQALVQLDDGTSNNRTSIRRNNANAVGAEQSTHTGTGNTASLTTNTLAINTRSKLAAYMASGAQRCALNSTLGTLQAGTLPATPTAVRVGSINGGAVPFNGYLERFALWPSTQLADATLQTLTTLP